MEAKPTGGIIKDYDYRVGYCGCAGWKLPEMLIKPSDESVVRPTGQSTTIIIHIHEPYTTEDLRRAMEDAQYGRGY